MKLHHLLLFSTISTFLALSACDLSFDMHVSNPGTVAFSPENDRVAILTNDYKLYTTDLNGNNLVPHNGGEVIYQLFTVTIDPFGDKLLYVKSVESQLRICMETGTNARCDTQLPSGAVIGVLSFLPNGDFLLIYYVGPDFAMQIYSPNGTIVMDESGFDQFFIARDIYKAKGDRWYITPYNSQSMRWALTRGTDTYLFTATSSSEARSSQLPGKINSAVQDVLKHRTLFDLKSGILSPDGSKVAFRTEEEVSQQKKFNLYVLDLSTENKALSTLVVGADFPIEFAFSPDSSQIVYESNQDGRSVWIANADGSAPLKLADNASMPNWWQ